MEETTETGQHSCSGKKIKTCQEGQDTRRRGQNLLGRCARHCSARITLSHGLGKEQQMLPRASLCCCSEIRNSGTELGPNQAAAAPKWALTLYRLVCHGLVPTLIPIRSLIPYLMLANISNPGCVHGGAADCQGSLAASQQIPQRGAAGAVAPLKLSLSANLNLADTERGRSFWEVENG